jgi:hypothetical protein
LLGGSLSISNGYAACTGRAMVRASDLPYADKVPH